MPWILVLLSTVAFHFLVVAYSYRLRGARFEILADTASQFVFETKVGHFRLDGKKREVLLTREDETVIATSFTEIRKLEYGMTSQWALGSEVWFGFGVTDLLKEYRDTHEWYGVALVLESGKKIPVYLAGQLVRRDFLMGWWLAIEQRLLAKLGLYRDVERTSLEVVEEIRRGFRQLGSPLQLA